MVGRRTEQTDSRPDCVREDVLRQTLAAQRADEVLRPDGGQDAARDAPVSGGRHRANPAAHRHRNQLQKLGTIGAGGYVWHTTGSGKTLTSFKTAQLASKLPSVDKVLFVVDRKDLDYQTMREYDRFQKGAANSNTSTAVLKQQLEDPNARIIITTIQKLATFIKANKGHAVYDGHVVIIFDECHRSQFGDMHTAITSAFRSTTCSGSRGHQSSPRTRGPAATRSCGRPSKRSATSYTPTRSSMRSPTGTCSRSASTT